MYKLTYLEVAKNDIEHIAYYISHNLNNKTAARNLLNKLFEDINKISIFPYGNPEYKPIKKLKYKYRKVKVKNFLVFYTVAESEKKIIIVRVLYKKMNIQKILK